MAKENIKPNEVLAPTLFIGVGGTGCGIVKMVAEMCRPEERENINFVCLDTNVNDLNNVKKGNTRIFYVQTSNTQSVGDYLNYDQDALKNWFPKSAVIYDKTVSEGAGQVRAISRLALNSTIKIGKIRPLYDAIDDLFRKDGKELKQALRIVMVSTASGGTGSGIILPLAMFVRDYVKNKYPNTSLIVRALILLPETLDSVIDSSVERESQRRNAYATIKEINAFMMKGSGFLDIDESLKRYSNLHIDFAIPGSDELKPLSLLPFDFCFLLDGQNAEDNTLVSVDQYKRQAARALYEQNIGPMQKDAFSVEDNIIKELSNPGNYGRNRFGGIGAGTIAYPYEDIADYIAYNWAISAIGGEGEAAKWSKYDNEFKVKLAEARKKGLPESECPKRGDVYVEKMNTSKDNFSKDLVSTFLSDASKRIKKYFSELMKEMETSVGKTGAIQASRNAVNALGQEIDYKDDANRGKAMANLEALRAFESAVRSTAKKSATSIAEGLFFNESKTINEKKDYTLEALMHNAYGDVAHPNAMRYLLYSVKKEFDNRIKLLSSQLMNDIYPGLELYASDANDVGAFDTKGTKKKKEATLDELCAAEKGEGQDPTLLEKLGGYDEIYKKLNEHFPAYYDLITRLLNTTADLEACSIGSEYVGELNEMFEKFFATFSEKVSSMIRSQEELVDALKFRKGDSVFNVCASKELLDELSKTTTAKNEENSMLDKELNASIFDAVKKNVIFERETRNADVVENDLRIDIFDEILLGYFKQSVRRECEDTIDKNVIEAIAMEARLLARIKARDTQEGGKIYDKVSVEDTERHIKEIISMGERLSAPGIQRPNNEEPREIKLCAYNKSLTEMRNFRMSDLLPKGKPVDSISRYELHFFNALYNLTPNKLSKFSSPDKAETREKNAGLYQNAYMTYARNIGPDSTKNASISTHIDKRWDSLAVMPEMDLAYQEKRVMKTHQALIYGLIHRAITYKLYSGSPIVKNSPKVYKYENSDERYVDLLVSNGTLCDEFYEILNSLYISPSIVEDIDIIKAKKRAADETRNSNYQNTTFAKDLEEFNIEVMHEGKTSLLEIPVAYFNSLPNSQRFSGEIAALADACIKTFKDELGRWETGTDVKFILANILYDQFMLLMDNYEKYETLNQHTVPSESTVLDIIFRKVRKEIETVPEPKNYEDMVRAMKERIH